MGKYFGLCCLTNYLGDLDFDIVFYAISHANDVFPPLRDLWFQKNWHHSLWHLVRTFNCPANCPHQIQVLSRLFSTPEVSCILSLGLRWTGTPVPIIILMCCVDDISPVADPRWHDDYACGTYCFQTHTGLFSWPARLCGYPLKNKS